MNVAWWYIEVMGLFLALVMIEGRWHVFSRGVDKLYDGILRCIRAMMRHTGDPAYNYQPKRYR